MSVFPFHLKLYIHAFFNILITEVLEQPWGKTRYKSEGIGEENDKGNIF